MLIPLFHFINIFSYHILFTINIHSNQKGESTLSKDRNKASQLIKLILQEKKDMKTPQSLRIGISGPPGVGKSKEINK